MKIFIGWAGERGKKTAGLLGAWLPSMIPDLEPWISMDSANGERFTPEIAVKIQKSRIGIFCLTSDNLDDGWLLFEADTLVKLNSITVCNFLLDIQPSDIKPPFSLFQSMIFTKDDIFRLVQTINHQLSLSPPGKPIPQATLGIIFNHFWPGFERKINEILQVPPPKNKKNNRAEITEEPVKRVDRKDKKGTDNREPVPVNILVIAERRYIRLVREIGVDPNDAIVKIMDELDKKYYLQSDMRNLILGHLMYFAHMKREPLKNYS